VQEASEEEEEEEEEDGAQQIFFFLEIPEFQSRAFLDQNRFPNALMSEI
jgi:hypothetical protein